jgi:hypothetical protein
VKRVIDHVILPAVGHPTAAVRQHQQAPDPGRSSSSDDKKETQTS